MHKFIKVLCSVLLCLPIFGWHILASAEDAELEFSLDVNSSTVPLPKIFRPAVDLSGRGFHFENTWPQGMSSATAINTWQKDLGFSGVYRLQYNLWEISQAVKNKAEQEKLLENYENIIKNISDAGGIAILDIFGTPAGMGKILDKKSAPVNLRAFKEFIRGYIRELSCNKKYNVWYEVWDAPDLDDFFLGREHDYLNLYKAVAQVVTELKEETKVYIPVGGPSTSWWFQNTSSNNLLRPERSLVYDLIRFCARNRLPLDFISWHAYSTDPKSEKEITVYNKDIAGLIRTWLSYFNMNTNIPLVVTEWNFDNGDNLAPERDKKAFIAASFLPARIKNMYEAGLNYQVFFSLEDFGRNLESINRNVGVFWFETNPLGGYKGGPKVIYNIFKLLAKLGDSLYTGDQKLNDEFVGVIATKTADKYSILVYNYIDTNMGRNFLSRNIATLHPAERKEFLAILKDNKLDKIISKEIDLNKLHLGGKLKALLLRAQELNLEATRLASEKRKLKLNIRNLKDDYQYNAYVVDSSTSAEAELKPSLTKDIAASDLYEDTLTLSPYSVVFISLEKKPKENNPAPESNQQGQQKF